MLYGQSPQESHHSTKFGSYRHFGSGDIVILVCQVISEDHVIEGSCDFMSRSPSTKFTILPSLVDIKHYQRDCKAFCVTDK